MKSDLAKNARNIILFAEWIFLREIKFEYLEKKTEYNLREDFFT